MAIEKPYTAVYPHNPTRLCVRVKPQVPKLVRDRLLELMSDLEWHSAWELEQELPQGEWVRAMRELMLLHFAFDRVSHSLKLRQKQPTESKQLLVELLAGIDATKLDTFATLPVEEVVKRRDEKLDDEEMIVEESFDPTKDARPESIEGPRLVLSENPDVLSLSVLDNAAMTCAILAKKGSGKTYLGMVLAEEFMSCLDLQIPVVVIDPTGVWPGLLATPEGRPSSFSMLVLGGVHADLAITRKQGSQAAEIVHELWPKSVLLDLSLMEPAEQHEFVADFGQRLFLLNVRAPLHLIVDEADEFAPQVLDSSSRHQKRSLGAIDRIVRRGRTKGFGVTLITQRSAVISKNVLSQIDSLFLLNMVAPPDLEAVSDWMRYGIRAEQRMECLGQLPNLPHGIAYFMQGGDVPKFRRFAVRKKKTFDSSRTPRPYEEIVNPVLSRASDSELVVARKWLNSPLTTENESDAEG